MHVHTVAILSPGDMGHAVGGALRASGLRVITYLAGRSARSRGLAEQAGIENLPSLEVLVHEADLVLSILVPSEAAALAERVAAALRATSARPAFADCNAIAPATVQQIEQVISAAGGRFIDAGIIGGPPGPASTPRVYASGAHAAILAQLDGRGIAVRVLDAPVGAASGLKMCYAAITKGTTGLQAAALTAAEALGLSAALHQELSESQPAAQRAMQGITRVSGKAFRWVGEMEQIAATFAAVGVTPRMHLGAADIFQLIADSPLGHERPETVDATRTLEQTVAIFAQGLYQNVERRTQNVERSSAPEYSDAPVVMPELPAGVVVRAWRAEDFPAIRRLSLAEGWSTPSERPEAALQAWQRAFPALVALAGTELVGFVRALSDGAVTTYVAELLVAPAWRQRGIATALLNACQQLTPGTRLDLLAIKESTGFYEAAGFRAFAGFRR